MINHAWLVLGNRVTTDYSSTLCSSLELVSSSFIPLELIGADAEVDRWLFGSYPDASMLHWRLAQVLSLFHANPRCVQLLRQLDPRWTYDPTFPGYRERLGKPWQALGPQADNIRLIFEDGETGLEDPRTSGRIESLWKITRVDETEVKVRMLVGSRVGAEETSTSPANVSLLAGNAAVDVTALPISEFVLFGRRRFPWHSAAMLSADIDKLSADAQAVAFEESSELREWREATSSSLLDRLCVFLAAQIVRRSRLHGNR